MKNPQDKAESEADLAQPVIGHGPCTYLMLLLLGLILLFPFLHLIVTERQLRGNCHSIVSMTPIGILAHYKIMPQS